MRSSSRLDSAKSRAFGLLISLINQEKLGKILKDWGIKQFAGVAVDVAKILLEGKDPLSRFNIIYANLPMKERVQTVVVINDQPISWEMVYREGNNKTKLGKEILKALIRLEIL